MRPPNSPKAGSPSAGQRQVRLARSSAGRRQAGEHQRQHHLGHGRGVGAGCDADGNVTGLRRRKVDRLGSGAECWTGRNRGASANWSAANRAPPGECQSRTASVRAARRPRRSPGATTRTWNPCCRNAASSAVRARSAACGNTTGYMVSYLALQDQLGNWGRSASLLRPASGSPTACWSRRWPRLGAGRDCSTVASTARSLLGSRPTQIGEPHANGGSKSIASDVCTSVGHNRVGSGRRFGSRMAASTRFNVFMPRVAKSSGAEWEQQGMAAGMALLPACHCALHITTKRGELQPAAAVGGLALELAARGEDEGEAPHSAPVSGRGQEALRVFAALPWRRRRRLSPIIIRLPATSQANPRNVSIAIMPPAIAAPTALSTLDASAILTLRYEPLRPKRLGSVIWRRLPAVRGGAAQGN